LKILFPIGSFYPDQSGGPANTVFWLAKAFTQKKVGITVVTSDRGIQLDFPFDKWLKTDFGRVIYLKTRQIMLPRRVIWQSILSARGQDLVYLNSIFYTLSFVLAPIFVLFGKKIVWAPRGELSQSALEFSSLKKKWVLKIVKSLHSKIYFHATSPLEAADIKSIFGSKTKLIELPCLIELPQKSVKNLEKTPYFLFIGRIHPIKAIDKFLFGLAMSKRFLLAPHTFIIVGNVDNEYGQQLKNLVTKLGLEKKVIFSNRVEGDVKNQVFSDAFCTVLPSFSENFGAVVAESLAQSTPVIAAKGTPWAELETFGAGKWVENEPEKLAFAIDEMLELTPIEYEKMRENAYKLVSECYDIEKNMDDYIQKFQQILQN
jgi:glycosyltransferase involved in cell wall biosynthesis